MHLEFAGKQDVYLEIATKLEGYILQGLYACNDKLPSIRALATELGVNPNTVARAYSVLEKKKLVCSLPKKGAFVIYRSGEEKSVQDIRPFLRELKARGVSYDDIIIQLKEVFDE